MLLESLPKEGATLAGGVATDFPLELWQTILDAVPNRRDKWAFFSTCRFFREYGAASYRAVLSSLQATWFPRLRNDNFSSFWEPPYPSNNPEFRNCLFKAAHTMPPGLFWDEMLANLPLRRSKLPCTQGSCECCWKERNNSHDQKKRRVNLRKARQLQREIWNVLGRLACDHASDDFKREFLRHAKEEPTDMAGLPLTVSKKHLGTVQRALNAKPGV